MKNKLLLVVFLAILFIYGSSLSNVFAAQTIAENDAAIIVATGETVGNDGLACYYYKSENMSALTFDLLQINDKGYFGVAAGNESDISDKSILTNSVIFDKLGNLSKNSSVKLLTGKPEWKTGKTYRFSTDYKLKQIKIECKNVDEIDGKYVAVASFGVSNSSADIMALVALSDKTLSASAVIDNYTLYSSDGKVAVKNAFDVNNIIEQNSMKVYTSNLNCYVDKYVQPIFTVSFVDENGSLIATQRVCYNGNALSLKAPDKEDYVFVKWSKTLIGITEDTVVYPIYRDKSDTESVDSVVDSNSEGEKQGKGCKGELDGAVLLAVLFLSSALLIGKKRKEDRNE